MSLWLFYVFPLVFRSNHLDSVELWTLDHFVNLWNWRKGIISDMAILFTSLSPSICAYMFARDSWLNDIHIDWSIRTKMIVRKLKFLKTSLGFVYKLSLTHFGMKWPKIDFDAHKSDTTLTSITPISYTYDVCNLYVQYCTDVK